MAAKRPLLDLSALTSDTAAPMIEAAQRTLAQPAATPPAPAAQAASDHKKTLTEDLQPLAFKVPPEFRKRFRQRAAALDMKLVELLVHVFDEFESRENSRK